MGRTRYKKTFWAVVIPVTLIAIFGTVTIIFALVHFSATDERVCSQCHSELISLWKQSNGHPAGETGCAQCHAKARRFLPDHLNFVKHIRDLIAPPFYSADDSLTSERCRDCHEDVLAPGYTPQKHVIHFTHRVHMQEGLICVHCHRTAGHQTQPGGSNRPTVQECLPCHIQDFTGPPKSQKCLSCHDVLLAPGRMIEVSR